MVFETLDPGEPNRSELYLAQVAQILANVNRDTKTRREPFELQDFLFDFDGSRKRDRTKPDQKMIRLKMELWRKGMSSALKKKAKKK